MKIFEANEKEFKTNGLGNIDVFKCCETKKKSLNGWFIEVELSSKYSELIKESYLACVETKEKGIQPFRICNVNRTDKTISFTAKHVVYDTENYLLDDVRPTNLMCYNFLNYLNTRLDSPTIFTVNSNISTSKTAYFIRKSFLEALSEAEALFNGTFDIDKFDISLNTTVNNISSETLIYGKNIQSMKVYENWDNVCTKILPVGPNEIMLPEKYLVSDVQYEKPYTRSITFSIETKKENGEDKTSSEMIAELRQLATQYLNVNKYPLLNYTVSSDVEQSLKIGDIIPVKHPLATFQTEVQEYRYNCLTKRIESVIFGNYERSVQKAFSEMKKAIKKSENQSVDFLKEARDDVYYLMNVGGKNGSVVFKKNNSGVISELFFIDTNDIETAKTVMRINNQGVGGSTTGINGPYNSAIMANGNIVADAIKSGTIQAIDIKGVNVTSSNISGGNISGTTITGTQINGNTISGGNISGTNINGGSIVGTTITGNTSINVGTDLTVGNNITLGTNNKLSKSIKTNKSQEICFFYNNDTNENYIIIKPTSNPNSYAILSDEAFYLSDKYSKSASLYPGGISHMLSLLLYGNISVSGTKNRLVKTKSYGNVLFNALETPTAIFEDNGSGIINDEGICIISFDRIVQESTNTKCSYFVQLTKNSSGDLYCDEKSEDYFIVKGTPKLKFDWCAKLKQVGYETTNKNIYENKVRNTLDNFTENSFTENDKVFKNQKKFEDNVNNYYPELMKKLGGNYE